METIDEKIARTESLLAAMKAHKQGRPVQVQVKPNTSWVDWSDPDFSAFAYRPKPQPKVIPYTMDNCPLVGVRYKYVSPATRSLIVEAGYEVTVGNRIIKYEELLRDYEHLDGSLCGTVVEE